MCSYPFGGGNLHADITPFCHLCGYPPFKNIVQILVVKYVLKIAQICLIAYSNRAKNEKKREFFEKNGQLLRKNVKKLKKNAQKILPILTIDRFVLSKPGMLITDL